MLRTRSISAALLLYVCALVPGLLASEPAAPDTLDHELAAALSAAGFTGTIQQTYQARIEANLGRPIDPRLVEIGRLLWFDTLHSLHADNTCGGCHSPTNGFGDTQPMAIGVQNNGLVGPHRTGPRNQRRSPLVINTALYPALMWNGRFMSLSGDPFDNSRGSVFLSPKLTTGFRTRRIPLMV
jgi:cytochrome c peroxidase